MTIENNSARLSAGAIILYQVLLIALIFLRPDLDPSWHTISEWAIGPFGWLMSLGFLVSALSYASLFVALRRHAKGWPGVIGLGILVICAVGAAGVGVFTTDPMTIASGPVEPTLTLTGGLHILFGSLQLMLLPFAALLVGLSLARNPEWKRFRILLAAVAFVPLIGLAGFVTHLVLVVVPMGETAYGPGVPIGWPPRILFLSYAVWVVATCSVAAKVFSNRS